MSETVPAKQINCRSCSYVYSSVRKYCARCGLTLTEPCPECRADGPVDQVYCSQCGVDRQSIYRERLDALRSKYDQAVLLRTQQKFQDALVLLASIARNKQEWSTEIRKLASYQVAEIKTERVAYQELASRAKVQATKYFDANQLQKAIDTVEKVPKEFRCHELSGIVTLARNVTEYLRTTRKQIATRIKAKQFAGLLTIVSQYLSKQPTDTQMIQLATRLTKQYVAEAKKRISQSRYEDGLALLQDIPGEIRDQQQQITRLHEWLTEVCYLWRDIQTAPCIDSTLVQVGERC